MSEVDTPAGIELPDLKLVGEEDTAAAIAPPPPAAVAAPAVASGRYAFKAGGLFAPAGSPSRGELRLDVDGRYALATASGELFWGLNRRVHWIASLNAAGAGQWTGSIWFKDGSTSLLPQTAVRVQVTQTPSRRATVSFGTGRAALTLKYGFASAFFRPVELEFDHTRDANPVLSIRTHDHPTRPSSMASEEITIAEVFRRAGFDVATSAGGGIVPLSIATGGASPAWSDAEMHDAMQVSWSRFSNRAQWAMWVFFAALHETGPSLGGIMFDAAGSRQRQGTAIFTEAFIKDPPNGDAAGAAWVRRMRFWTACHEMGHSFNLAHSWQKGLGTAWIPLVNAPEDRSFMNYPFRVSGGQSRFFSDFEFRFSDSELLFMRHAPERFVQMGNAAWFDHHGFEQAAIETEPSLRLELRVNRRKATFEFMEPAVVECKLTNVSGEPVLLDPNVLSSSDALTVVVKRDGDPAKVRRPLAHRCWKSPKAVLEPGKSWYETLFAAVDRDGWLIAEPGYYTVQVALHVGDEDVVSNPLRLRVAPAHGFQEEYRAQDLFTEDVGRVLAFDGSRQLHRANDTLRQVAEQFPERRVAAHARVALAAPLARAHKHVLVDAPEGAAASALYAQPDEARQLFEAALVSDAGTAVESLAHKDYRYYMERFSAFLAAEGDTSAAADVQQTLYEALAGRPAEVKVKASVLEEVKDLRDAYRRGEVGS